MVDGRTFTTSFVIHIAQHVVPSSFDPGVHIDIYMQFVWEWEKMYWPFNGASECFTLFIGSLSLRETRGKSRPGPGERFLPSGESLDGSICHSAPATCWDLAVKHTLTHTFQGISPAHLSTGCVVAECGQY